MPEDPLTPSPEGPAPSEPTKFASSDHPSGDTWRKDDAPTRSADSFPPGAAQVRVELIGDFEVIGTLGQGGMGAVYRARQRSLDRQVALKILPAKFETDSDYVTRFQREARVAASLSHPNLVKVYSSGVADGCHYIAMELVEGETLSQWLKRGAIPTLEALRIILNVVQALDCGWRTAHLIHRDIKPGNIFLSEHGDVKLGDLGLAKIVGSDTTGLTQTGFAMGTPHYISPEQARGDRDLDFRADIYSLGCTLYHMLTGRTPYSGTEPMVVMNQHVNAAPPAILKAIPQCPIPVARLVGKMLKKQRRERFGSYEELIAAIESVRAQLDPPLAAPTNPARSVPVSVVPAQAPASSSVPSSFAGKAPSRGKLYGGIAAGVVALVVGWLLWPKEEALTAAQRYARDHPPQQPETQSSQAAEITSPGAAPSTNEGSPDWIDWITEKRGAGRFVQNPTFQDEGAFIRVKNDTLMGIADPGFYDGEIRVTWIIPPASSSPNRLFVRRVSGAGKSYRRYQATMTSSEVVLQREESDEAGSAKQVDLRKSSYPAGFQLTKECTLVLRAKGSALTAFLNGQELWSAEIESDARAGAAGMYLAKGTLLQKMEYRSLDKSTTQGANSTVTPEKWQDLLRDPAKLVFYGGAEQTSEGLRFNDAGSAGLISENNRMSDGAVRMSAPFAAAHPKLRIRRTDRGNYQLGARNATTISLEIWDNIVKKNTILRDFPLNESLTKGVAYELELRAIGRDLTVKCNGVVLGTVSDATFSQGEIGLAVTERNAGTATVSSFERLDLDLPAPSK